MTNSINSVEPVKVECVKIDDWCKIIKGKLPFQTFIGPCRLLIKYKWEDEPIVLVENGTEGILYFKEPLILTEGMYFKLEQF